MDMSYGRDLFRETAEEKAIFGQMLLDLGPQAVAMPAMQPKVRRKQRPGVYKLRRHRVGHMIDAVRAAEA